MSSRREAPSTTKGTRPTAPLPLFRPATSDAPEPGLIALRRLLLQRWPGRLFLGGLAVRLVLGLIDVAGGTDLVSGVLGTLARLAILVGGLYLLGWVFQRGRTRVLWRVRERLVVSYLFIGVVPALLIAAFFLFGILVLGLWVSGYLFVGGVQSVVGDTQLVARVAAEELERSGGGAAVQATLERQVSRWQQRFPGLSLVVVPRAVTTGTRPGLAAPAAAGRTSLVRAGAWAHLPAPDRLPSWIGQGGFADVIAHRGATIVGINGDAAVPAGSEPVELVVRAVAQSRSHEWSVIADVPLDETMWSSIEDSTGITMLSLGDTRDGALASAAAAAGATAAAIPSSWIRKVVTRGGGKWVLEPYIFVRFQDWASRSTGLVKVYIRIAPDEMYRRIAAAQGSSSQNQNMAQATIVVLGLIGILFIIIEGAALAMGWALARSITRSVHALFTGTERLRLGDLGHRIPIWSRDQLGELAESFNAMTANLETLLEQQAEKRRLEEELRIAREIQMSLLPRKAPPIAGLSLAAFCEPAREVGGDYYDFFVLGPGRLGMLVADVAGKGTSAALYMAELKGLMLSLSQIHESPRTLLVEVNRIIADNLDSRSFITMTYAVVDMGKRTLTYARAGHTPLIHRTTASPAVATLVAPNGMVVGLQLDGLEHKFEELLEEETVPLVDGDVFVLFTDGVSEAMSGNGDLYGEERLRVLVEEHGGLGSDGLRERIARDVELHVAGADRHDDMTMIVVTVERTAGA